jgi:hypothetical protein
MMPQSDIKCAIELEKNLSLLAATPGAADNPEV